MASHNDKFHQPKYSCIEEWDAIHAMWLYEMMELSDTDEDVNDRWRATVQTKGLILPILLKVSTLAEVVKFCTVSDSIDDSSILPIAP